MAKTTAQARKQVRREEMRVFLSERGKVQYVLENIEKIEQLDTGSANFQKDLLKLKTANEQRLKLLNKYLPDAREEINEIAELPPIVINLANSESD